MATIGRARASSAPRTAMERRRAVDCLQRPADTQARRGATKRAPHHAACASSLLRLGPRRHLEHGAGRRVAPDSGERRAPPRLRRSGLMSVRKVHRPMLSERMSRSQSIRCSSVRRRSSLASDPAFRSRRQPFQVLAVLPPQQGGERHERRRHRALAERPQHDRRRRARDERRQRGVAGGEGDREPNRGESKRRPQVQADRGSRERSRRPCRP